MEKHLENGIVFTDRFTQRDIETSLERQKDIFGGEFGFLDSAHDFARQAVREFCRAFRRDRDFMLVAKKDGKFIGTITLMGEEDGRARLRFLILEPDMRGVGLGKKILSTAMEWAKDMGYTHIWLTTHSVLERAVNMYKSMGFEKTGEVPADDVCPGATEITFERDI